jgi:hypothetical protein
MSSPSPDEAIIRAFLRPERAERFLALLARKDGRRKLRRELAHLRAFDDRYLHRVAPNAATPQALAALLRGKGAPAECYCLSEHAAVDGRVLPLLEALTAVVGSGMGTIVSCVPGRLAFFEGEEPGERYVLERVVG